MKTYGNMTRDCGSQWKILSRNRIGNLSTGNMDRNFDSLLVNKACVTLGKMLDFAVHSLRQNADAFFEAVYDVKLKSTDKDAEGI